MAESHASFKRRGESDHREQLRHHTDGAHKAGRTDPEKAAKVASSKAPRKHSGKKPEFSTGGVVQGHSISRPGRASGGRTTMPENDGRDAHDNYGSHALKAEPHARGGGVGKKGGGKKPAHVNVNVINAHPSAPPPAAGLSRPPLGGPAPMARPPMATPAPPPPGPPPGPGPAGAPGAIGMPPGGAMPKPPGMLKRGGRVSTEHLTAGAKSGEARLIKEQREASRAPIKPNKGETEDFVNKQA